MCQMPLLTELARWQTLVAINISLLTELAFGYPQKLAALDELKKNRCCIRPSRGSFENRRGVSSVRSGMFIARAIRFPPSSVRSEMCQRLLLTELARWQTLVAINISLLTELAFGYQQSLRRWTN